MEPLMKKTSSKLPTGKWESADPEITMALGLFVQSWSLIESTV
jgi:hypothetical protein